MPGPKGATRAASWPRARGGPRRLRLRRRRQPGRNAVGIGDSGDQTSGKVATGVAPAAAKKKVPVPGAKRDKCAASTANKKAPVTTVKRAKGLASTSKKM
ncbi:uncharacterized protein [Miscanthus floridulus]